MRQLAWPAIALFYRGDIARCHLLSWFLTMLVVVAFLHETGAIRGWRNVLPIIHCRDGLHPASRGCKRVRHEQ